MYIYIYIYIYIYLYIYLSEKDDDAREEIRKENEAQELHLFWFFADILKSQCPGISSM